MKKITRHFFFLSLVLVTGLASCTNYGKKVSKDYLEVYYKDGVSKEQAQKTLDFLYPYWKEGEKTARKSVQLEKIKDTITFRMVTDEKKMQLVTEETLYQMSNIFSDSLFNSAPVNIDLTNDHFKSIRTLHFKKVDLSTEEPATGNGQ